MTFHDSSDASMGSNQYGLLTPLPAAFVSLVDSFRLFYIISAVFEANKSMVDFKRTSQIWYEVTTVLALIAFTSRSICSIFETRNIIISYLCIERGFAEWRSVFSE